MIIHLAADILTQRGWGNPQAPQNVRINIESRIST
jgi:hypothetical protein